jgi:hypothetical protein
MSGGRDRSSDQRRARRATTELRIHWVRESGVLNSTSADVSQTGLFVRSPEPVAVGELLELECELPDGPLRLIVTVRHVSSEPGRPGFGVSLFADNTASAKRWQRFCSELIPPN